ncbi:accessory Sec system protein translocase subunit SecY2 [Enterococcus sp. LJL98]
MEKNKNLIRKICWSILFLFLLQIGKHIYVPGFFINENMLQDQSTLARLLSSATGGQYGAPTLFSLGMSPYMTGLIIWSTITMIDIDAINNLSIKQRSFYQKLLTLIFTVLQAIGLVFRFKANISFEHLERFSQVQIMALAVLIVTAGGMVLTWLADMNCEKGVGAQSVFIIPSLIANLPAMLVSGQSKEIPFNGWTIGFIVGITLLFVVLTLYLYKAEYRLPIERTGIDSQFNQSYIPIRLLTAGAMPYMFATTIFSLPQLLLLNQSLSNTPLSWFLTTFFSFNTVQGILTYGLIIFILAIGFSFVNIRPHDIAKNMKYSGDYILGVVPGDKTEKYVRDKLLLIASTGNLYLVVVSVIPLFVGLHVPFVSNLALFFGSTFMLIIILDNLYQELEFLYFNHLYSIF